MLKITPSFHIDERDLQFEFIRASGPGGQNVNKVATAVQLRYDVRGSSLPEEAKARLLKLSGRRANSAGILTIDAKQFRTQERNREEAIRRFIELVRRSLVKPKARRITQPTKSSKEKRLTSKKRRGEIKKNRLKTSFDQ